MPDNLSEEAKAIIAFAQRESELFKHFYIGTEHIFIALTKIEGGLTQGVLRHMSLEPKQVRDTIRRWVGLGDGYRYWDGFIFTPRSKEVLQLASEEASKTKFKLLGERELLLGILKEGEGIPARILQMLNVPISEMIKLVEEEKIPVVAGKVPTTSDTPLLESFGRDMTLLAKEGKIDPVIGREREMLEVIHTLTRKTKSNPLLIGEAGVGKTAIIEGLALRIASGDITEELQGKRLVELNTASLVAGTIYRGQFEERLMGIIKEASNPDIILFIDEIHTLVGAGKGEGGMDASNIFKSALSKGDIRCIGATTVDEYRRYIEKDAAFERRFQPIIVEEPTVYDALLIINGLKKKYEHHHHVKIADSATKAAVELSARYLPDRHLPDKALDLLDEACSRKKAPGLSLGFKGEKEDLEVTEEDIAIVLAEWTDLPVKKLTEGEQDHLLQMTEILKKRIIGQDEAVEKVSKRIKMARTGLQDPNHPIGVFLFLGPTGVGKTEMTKALSSFLFGSEQAMIRIDMSEYMEAHSVARLIGAPPGYVGYESEGQLTGALRRKPYTVVLLDEIEKAHPEIFNLFLQIFDDGRVTDTKGRVIDAKNAIFIMTSNIGSDIYSKDNSFERAYGAYSGKDKVNKEEILQRIKAVFRPEFLNRIDEIIIFNPLGTEEIEKIAHIQLNKLSDRLAKKGIILHVKDEMVKLICRTGYDPLNGARPLRRTIEHLIAEPLSEKILKGELREGSEVVVDIQGESVEWCILESEYDR